VRALLLPCLATLGCASDSGGPADPDPDPDPIVVDDQNPPITHAELTTWIADGAYLTWACEPDPHPARPPGAHGVNRICSNDVLSASASGPFPVGAATVKELYRDDQITGYAVMRKLAEGTAANTWYWYEVINGGVVADGRSPGICTGCHGGAPRDHIFTRVE
jgi:hypothetical protein